MICADEHPLHPLLKACTAQSDDVSGDVELHTITACLHGDVTHLLVVKSTGGGTGGGGSSTAAGQ